MKPAESVPVGATLLMAGQIAYEPMPSPCVAVKCRMCCGWDISTSPIYGLDCSLMRNLLHCDVTGNAHA